MTLARLLNTLLQDFLFAEGKTANRTGYASQAMAIEATQVRLWGES